MAEVITRLKVDNAGYDQKIKAAQRSLDQFGLKGSAVGKNIQGLAGALKMNIGALTPWGAALAAAGGAMKVLGDAFMENEALADQWRGSLEGAKGVYKSFLSTITSGDWKNFRENIKGVFEDTKKAYDALDALGTYNAFNQVNMARSSKNFKEAEVGYRQGNVSQTGLQAAAEEYKKQLEVRAEFERKSFDAAIQAWAKQHNADAEEVKRVMEGSYQDFIAAQEGGGSLGTALKQMTDADVQRLQNLRAAAEKTGEEMADIDKRMARLVKGDKVQTGGGASTAEPIVGLINQQEEEVKRLQTAWESETDAEKLPERKAALEEAKLRLQELRGELEQVAVTETAAFQTGSLEDLKAQLKDATAEMESLTIGTDEWAEALKRVEQAEQAVADAQNKIKPGKVEKAGDGAVDASHNFQMAASAVNSLSGAMAQMEDPAAKIAGLIGQAIASIALTFASSLKGTATPWDWIAAAAAGTATMIGTIAAIKQATEYHADGGFVGGGPFVPRGSDTVPAMLTPGELVLTRSMQNNLASQLQPATPQVNITGRLSGRDILLAADNTNRSRGGSRGVYSRVR